jgi:hypothetical protein
VSRGDSSGNANLELAEFGEPEAHFRVGGYHYRMLRIGGFLGILVGLGFLGLIGLLAFFGGRGPQGREWSSLLHGVVFAVAALAAGAAALSRSRGYRGLQILVCSRGLVCMRDDALEQLPWQSIRSVQRVPKSVTGISHSWQPGVSLVLERIDGTKIVLDETLQHLEHFRELVEEHTLDHLLAPALEKLRAGGAISFGQATVSPGGIHTDKALLPWTQYGMGVAEQSQVTIYDERGQSFCKLEITAVPNVHVLLALAEFLGRAGKVKSISEGLSS